MELIADGLLFLGALVASVYCIVLSRRLKRLTQLEDGLGGAITALSSQVDEMSEALAEAKRSTQTVAGDLQKRVETASAAEARLDALVRTAVSQSTAVSALLDAASARAQALADTSGARAEKAAAKPGAVLEDPVEGPSDDGPSVSSPETREDLHAIAQDATSTDFEPLELAPLSQSQVGLSTLFPGGEGGVGGNLRTLSVATAVDAVSDEREGEDDEAFAKRLIEALAETAPASADASS